MKEQEARETGYSGAADWCLNCDVSWAPSSRYAPDSCWICGSAENVWRWVPRKGMMGVEFKRMEVA